MQVDDCLKKFMWSRDMMAGLAKLKREGKPMPKSIEEFKQLMGTYVTPAAFGFFTKCYQEGAGRVVLVQELRSS